MSTAAVTPFSSFVQTPMEEAESHPDEAERRKKDAKREGGERGGDQGSPEGAGGREGPKQREVTEGGREGVRGTDGAPLRRGQL